MSRHPWSESIHGAVVQETSLVQTTAPAVEPVDEKLVKDHLKITDQSQDQLLKIYIKAVREMTELFLGRSLLKQVWDWAIDGPPSGVINLPKAPLITVDLVQTFDLADAATTFPAGNYVVDTDNSRFFLKTDFIWPVPLRSERSVVVGFTSGYGTVPGDVPAVIRLAILKSVGHFWENRELEAKLPAEAMAMLTPFSWKNFL